MTFVYSKSPFHGDITAGFTSGHKETHPETQITASRLSYIGLYQMNVI